MKGILHHIEFYVSDLEKSKKFWEWLLTELGYKKYQEWNNGISFKLEDTYLVFVQTEDKYQDIKYHRKRTGLNHIAFHVDNREQIDYFTLKLKERGVSVLYEEKHPFAGGDDHCAIYFEDPDRIKVELVG